MFERQLQVCYIKSLADVVDPMRLELRDFLILVPAHCSKLDEPGTAMVRVVNQHQESLLRKHIDQALNTLPFLITPEPQPT